MVKSCEILRERYKILKMVGSGGFSRVYLAEDLVLPKTWAIKEFSCEHLDEKDKKEIEILFKKEANILSSLNHPTLPAVADFFSENGKKYIVMEFFEGKTLEEIIKQENKALPEKTVRKWAVTICKTLDYLHNCNPPVIHRDVKPENLIITEKGELKFIDFGIARIFNPVKKQDTLFMGTPGFASPEQFGRGQSDRRSDIYSLGATLHYLLSNHNPAENPFKFSPVTLYNPSVSKEMEEIITKAVEIEPCHRFTSVMEIMTVLSGNKSIKELPPAPMLLIEPSEILLDNVPWKKTKTAFRVKNMGGGSIEGQIRSENQWIKLKQQYFRENWNEINMEIDTKKLNREEKHTGSIEIITRFMKKTVPVEISFRPPFLERLPVWILCILIWTIPVLPIFIFCRFSFLISGISISIFYASIFKLIAYGCIISFISTKFIPGICVRLSPKQKKIIVISLMLTIIFPTMYLTYLFYSYIGVLTFLVIINILPILWIYEKFSTRQKEETKVPFMISLLSPTGLLIAIHYLNSTYYFYKINMEPIITIFSINIFVILFYFFAKKTNHFFNSWYEKIEKGKKPLCSLQCLAGYIYAYLLGEIWGIAGVFCFCVLNVKPGNFCLHSITLAILQLIFLIPIILNNIYYGAPAVITTALLSVTGYHFLKEYKYGKVIMYISIVLIIIGALYILNPAESLIYPDYPIHFTSGYPIPPDPRYIPTPHPVYPPPSGAWPQYIPGNGITLK